MTHPFTLATIVGAAIFYALALFPAHSEGVNDIINIPKVVQNMKIDGAMKQKTKEVRGLNDLMKQTLGTPGSQGAQSLGFLNESSQVQDSRGTFRNITMPDGSKGKDPNDLVAARQQVRKLYYADKAPEQMTPALQEAYMKARTDSERRVVLDAYALSIGNRNSATVANDQVNALAERAASAPNARADVQANHAAMIASVHALGRTQAALASMLQMQAAVHLRAATPANKPSSTVKASEPQKSTGASATASPSAVAKN